MHVEHHLDRRADLGRADDAIEAVREVTKGEKNREDHLTEAQVYVALDEILSGRPDDALPRLQWVILLPDLLDLAMLLHCGE